MAIFKAENHEDRDFMMNLYKDYYALARKTVHIIINDNDHVEDLINDTFIKLIVKIDILRNLNNCQTAAYVVYTARSVAINFTKRRNVENKYLFYGEDPELMELISDTEGLEERIIHQEEIEALVKAVLRLPEKEKNLLYFKYILEMTDSDIAEIFNIAAASVRQYLSRARRQAKKLLDKEMSIFARQSGTNKEKAL